MAVLARLMVPIGGDASDFSRELARASKLADSWSSSITSKTMVGLGNGLKPLTLAMKGLNAGRAAVEVARFGTTMSDAVRVVKGAGLGFDRMRLMFMSNGVAADQLREKIGRTSSSLHAMHKTAITMRIALGGIDLAGFVGQLGVMAMRLGGDVVGGFARASYGALRFGIGIAETIEGVVTLVPNVLLASKALLGWVAAAKGSAVGAASLATAWYHGRKALFDAIQVGGGLWSIGSGAIGAAKGVAQLSLGMAKIGWKAAVTAAKLFVAVLKTVGSTALSVAGSLAKVGAAVGLIGGYFALKAAASAAHLEETYNKTRQTFGEFADEVLKTSKTMNTAFGVDEQPFLDGTAAIGSMLKGMGYAQEDAAKLGTNLVRLAADSKAFRDVGLDTAIQKIRSGLSGEAEPLKEFGILIDEATTKSYAYASGIAKTGEALTQAQKVQARMGLITQGLADDMGALSREADGTAAQMAEFWGRVETLKTTIGATLAPIVGAALQKINTWILVLTDSWDSMADAAVGAWNWITETVSGFVSGAGSGFLSWGKSVFDFFELAGVPTMAWNTAIGIVANTLQYLELGFKLLSSGALRAIGFILQGFAKLIQGLGWVTGEFGRQVDALFRKVGLGDGWFDGVGDGVTATGDYLDRLADKTHGLAQHQADAFRDAWNKPVASTVELIDGVNGAITGAFDGLVDGGRNAMGALNQAYDQAVAKIQRAREQLAGSLDFDPKTAPKDVFPKVEKEKESKAREPFAKAMLKGSAEATALVLKNRYGPSGRDQVAENTKKTAAGVNQVAKELAALPAKLAGSLVPVAPPIW